VSNKTELSDLIEGGENLRLEFKGTVPKEHLKWIKTAVAFANGSGGKILIGVDDDRNIIGVPSDSAFSIADGIVCSVSDRCEPQISISTSVQDIDGRTIIIADIYPGNNRPYYVRDLGIENGTFIRIGATTRLADPYSLDELRIQGQRRTFDTLQNSEIGVSEENTKSVCDNLSALNGRPIDRNMIYNSGAILRVNGEDIATNAYALLCDKSPFLFTEFRCAMFAGSNETEFIDRADYRCPITSQIKNAYQFVQRNIRFGGKVEGLVRNDDYELPMNAIREIIVNAVQHRSYVNPNNPIYLAIYNDRIEVTSPGGLPASLDMEMMRQGRAFHRNPVISKLLRTAGVSEGWGNGIKTIISECKRYGLPAPIFENSGIDFRVTVYRRTSGTIDIEASLTHRTDSRHEILRMIQLNPGFTTKDLSECTNIPIRTVERMISSLKSEGILIRSGSARKGQWILRQQMS